MNAFHKSPMLHNTCPILADCTRLEPQQRAYLEHPIMQRFGHPNKPMYIDMQQVSINDVDYGNPLILPILNGDLETIQYAFLQDNLPIQFEPVGLAKGFAAFGQLERNKPIFITYNLEAFFKIAETGHAVVMVVLNHLCKQPLKPLAAFDVEQIKFVIKLLSSSGYERIYMPIRPEHRILKDLGVSANLQIIEQFTNEDSIDLTQYDDTRVIKLFLDNAIKSKPALVADWGELTPLNQEAEKHNPYPIEALPSIARNAVMAIAEHVQSPISMTAQCVIGAMSHIAQSRVNAPHPFNPTGEPCSLYLLTEGQSGSRKSTSRYLADKAIAHYERKQYELYRADLEQWKSGQASLGKKDREAYCIENPPPQDPSSLFSDITLESIAGLFIDGILTNASIASDEAGQFFGGHTMKADTRNQALGGYAKLFDDGFVERTRSKSNLNGSGRAYDVRLTFNLQGQREILADALKDPVLRGQGFLPRFILTIPENLAGTRLQDVLHQDKSASEDNRLLEYWQRCEYLLDDSPQVINGKELFSGRYVIPMDESAKAIDLQFYNIFELSQGKGKQYEYLQAFASRASQLARRLATVFAYFEGLQVIDGKTLRGAYEVIQHSLNEWAVYSDIEVKSESDVEKLIRYLTDKCRAAKTNRIAKSDALKSAPSKLRKVRDFDATLEELISHNYLRLISLNQKQYIELNPALLK